jgi:hypothetical protein
VAGDLTGQVLGVEGEELEVGELGLQGSEEDLVNGGLDLGGSVLLVLELRSRLGAAEEGHDETAEESPQGTSHDRILSKFTYCSHRRLL